MAARRKGSTKRQPKDEAPRQLGVPPPTVSQAIEDVDRCLYNDEELRKQIRESETVINTLLDLLPQKPTADEAPHVATALRKVQEIEAELVLLRARTDFNAFAETVMRDDETGLPLKQSATHRRWTELCEEHKHLIIWSARNTGKSTQLSIARTVWELGRDPTLRFLILSNTAAIAQKILSSIKILITDHPTVKQIFPHLKPNPQGPWTNTQIQVVRDSFSPSPSVMAAGIHGSVTGMRVDRLVVDDILDYENTNTEAERRKTMGWYKATVPGCFTRRVKVLIVGTAYHPMDFIHDMSKVRGFKWFRFPLVTDTGRITWPEKFDEERIQRAKDALGPAEFARQFLCKARDDGESRFKQEWIDAALKRGTGVPLILSLDELSEEERVQVKTFTGVDLSSGKKKKKTDLTSFFTFLQYPNGDRRVAMIEAGKLTGPEIIDKVEETHARYGSLIAVEDNGAQSYILQFATKASNVPVMPHTTGKQKRDPVLGVEGLAIELANGKWIIPKGEDGTIHPEISAWITDMLFFDPKAHTGDRLMSCYFARELARRFAGEARRPKPQVVLRTFGGESSSETPKEVYRDGPSLRKIFDVPDMP